MTDPIIQAAARALCDSNSYEELLAAVTPLIEAAALEKAAKMVEEGWGIPSGTPQDEVAAAIRALIPKDSGGGD